jgi:hypothetical protein
LRCEVKLFARECSKGFRGGPKEGPRIAAPADGNFLLPVPKPRPGFG